jgi:hypothetical protein
MWFSWAFIGLAQIYLNRYLRHYWRISKIMHAILGTFALALVVTAGFISIKTGGWKINTDLSLHAKLGFSWFVMGITLMLGGITANIIRLKVPMNWRTRWMLSVGKVHKYFGWFIVLGSQFVIATGFINFYTFDDKKSLGWALAGASCAFFFIGLISGEVWHQFRLRAKMPHVAPESGMSSAEFQEAIANGRKLVILDELVLDVGKFTEQHPGGRFVLQHNVGRDISKFFYGGYCLEDNMGPTPSQGHAHSTFAKTIVCDLAIARYQPLKAVTRTECRVIEELCHDVNATTKTIVFESLEGRIVPNWKKYYPNVDYIGKHFLVRNIAATDRDSVWRHYTICNAMKPEYYEALIKALKDVNDENYV